MTVINDESNCLHLALGVCPFIALVKTIKNKIQTAFFIVDYFGELIDQ